MDNTKGNSSATPDGDTDDIAVLWSQAIEKYRSITGNDLVHAAKDTGDGTTRSIESILSTLTAQESSFSKWRNNDSKTSKLRGALKQCLIPLDGLSKFVSSAAAVSFPASGVVFASISFMVDVFNKVSADYDMLAAFFEDLHLYLDRLKILDGNVPTPMIIRKCLVDILVHVLIVIGISTKNIKEGRGLKFLKRILPGEDKELSAAYEQLKKLVEQEEKLIGNQTLVNSAITLKKLEKLSDLDEKLDKNYDAIKTVQDQIEEMHSEIKDQKAAELLDKIKNHFNPQTADEYDRKESFLIKDTATWIFQEESYKKWRDGDSRVLWVSGGPGVGNHLFQRQ